MYPPAAAARLRDRGVDAVAVTESMALAGLDDEFLLALAALDQRVLVTENISDFALLGRTAEHVGIVFCHLRRFPRGAAHIERLVDALVPSTPPPLQASATSRFTGGWRKPRTSDEGNPYHPEPPDRAASRTRRRMPADCASELRQSARRLQEPPGRTVCTLEGSRMVAACVALRPAVDCCIATGSALRVWWWRAAVYAAAPP